MTVYGDLEVSTLTQLPRGRGRSPHVVPVAEKPAFLDRAWRRVREEVAAGPPGVRRLPADRGGGPDERRGRRRAPDDPGGDRRPPLAVLDVAPMLARAPAGLRIGVLHGRLPADEKDAVMRAFAAGELDVLVATTVVEVGVDVPNATVMVVMDADRFGVSPAAPAARPGGPGLGPGLCLLVTEARPASLARERLDAVASTTDGFGLAQLDLEQRREGDVLGAAQSGRRSHLRLLSLRRDAELIADARAEAMALLDTDPAWPSTRSWPRRWPRWSTTSAPSTWRRA